jgi:hypothetical protein
MLTTRKKTEQNVSVAAVEITKLREFYAICIHLNIFIKYVSVS